ncbi:unnamed protein product [Lasius platythorax]|uniref:Uncharacterized protein n=1 Tax=Lasius platythorax TaxID=488582 RepID=A0AAV2N300_9HYME
MIQKSKGVFRGENAACRTLSRWPLFMFAVLPTYRRDYRHCSKNSLVEYPGERQGFRTVGTKIKRAEVHESASEEASPLLTVGLLH